MTALHVVLLVLGTIAGLFTLVGLVAILLHFLFSGDDSWQ